MDEQINISELKTQLDDIQKSVNTMKRYMQITFWVTVVVFVLPLVGIVFILPSVINSYTQALGL